MKDEVMKNLTFEKDDKLERKENAKVITELLLNKDNLYNTICVNSEWGTGKTWFVHMWINMLKIEYMDDIIPIYYNAWENDDYENAFVPMISEIDGQLSEAYSDFDFAQLRAAAGMFFLTIANNTAKLLSLGIIDFKPSAEKIKEESLFQNYVSTYRILKEEKDKFKQSIQQFAEESNKKIFVFVDELDRCRPTFAIETLERIKHFFDVEGCCFILMLDREQLSYSVKVLYGSDCDTTGYLRRFIDIEYSLTEPSIEKYFEFKIGVNSRTQFFYKMLTFFNLSLRDIDKLKMWIEAYLNIYDNKEKDDYVGIEIKYIFAYLLMLNLKYPEVFKKFFDTSKAFSYAEFYKHIEIDNYLKSENRNLRVLLVFWYIRKNIPAENWSITSEELEKSEEFKNTNIYYRVKKMLSLIERFSKIRENPLRKS